MKKVIAILNIAVFGAILAIPVSVSAQEPAVMALLRGNYGGARAVSAQFELSIYWDVREREEKKSGELHIVPGDKFRVTLGRDVFVSDGRTFWQYNERNAQVVVRNFSDIEPSTLPSGMLASFLSGRNFTVQSQNDGTARLAWSGDDGEYKEISVSVNERSGVISVLRMKDKNDNIHTYTFNRTTFDKPPKNDVFRFSAPRGVETLDMRENL